MQVVLVYHLQVVTVCTTHRSVQRPQPEVGIAPVGGTTENRSCHLEAEEALQRQRHSPTLERPDSGRPGRKAACRSFQSSLSSSLIIQENTKPINPIFSSYAYPGGGQPVATRKYWCLLFHSG